MPDLVCSGSETGVLSDKLTAIRAEFPVLESQAYLNTGTAGPLSRQTAAAISRQVEHELMHGRASIGATVHQYFRAHEELHDRYARLLGAEPREIAITHHTTEGMHIAVWGLKWQPGDEIITTNHEHEGGLLPIYAAARHLGLTVRVVDVGPDSREISRTIEMAISHRTRLVVVSHVSYRTGVVLPLAEIAAVVHRAGAFLAVDGAQSAGTIPVDVHALNVDAYAISGQKWLCGPEGVGALYVRTERIGELSPTFIGHLSLRDFNAIDLSGYYVPGAGARRYAGGTLFWPGLVGMVESLRYLEDTVGYDWIFEQTRVITARAREIIGSIEGLTILSPPGNIALTAFSVPGIPTRQVVDCLFEKGVIVRSLSQPSSLRISTGFFTAEPELVRLADALEILPRRGGNS